MLKANYTLLLNEINAELFSDVKRFKKIDHDHYVDRFFINRRFGNRYKDCDIYALYASKSNDQLFYCEVVLTYEIVTQGANGPIVRSAISEPYLFLFVKCNDNYQCTINIRPEKLADKINEMFKPVELDFPDNKEFSKGYYVLTDNKDMATEFLSSDVLDALIYRKDLYINFKDRYLTVRTYKTISKPEVVDVINIGDKLTNAFKSVTW